MAVAALMVALIATSASSALPMVEDGKMATGSAKSDAAARCVIGCVARVGFYDGKGAPEDDLLPSCVKAILKLRGEDLGFLSRPGAKDPWHDLHCYLLGMSGCGFRFACHPTKWSAADGSPWLIHEDPTESARSTRCIWLMSRVYSGAGGAPVGADSMGRAAIKA